MEKPIYVIKTNETVSVPNKDNKFESIMRTVVWTIIVFIIVDSLIFGENLWSDIS